jgi:hypothetical protein
MGVEIKCGPLLYWYLRQLLQGGIGNVLITKTASKKKNLLRSLSLNKMFSIGVKKKMIDTQIIKDHTREWVAFTTRSCLLERKVTKFKMKEKVLKSSQQSNLLDLIMPSRKPNAKLFHGPTCTKLFSDTCWQRSKKNCENYAAETMQSIACLQIPVIVASGPYTCNKNINSAQPQRYYQRDIPYFVFYNS